VQSEVSEQVAAALASAEPSAAIQTAEMRKLSNASPENLEAYQLYLLAVEGNARFTKEDIKSGLSNATRAIELDPLFARAYAIRARLWFNSTHFGEDRDTAMQAMWRDAEKAVSLDPNGAEARLALAWYYSNSGRMADADAQITQALQQNPANIAVMKVAAAIYATSGRPVEATVLADKVLKLDPMASAATLNTVKDAYFFAGRFSDAVAVISRVPEAARSRGSWLLLTFSLAMLDRKDDFQRARSALLAKYPSISAELLLNQGWSFSREKDRQSFLRGFEVSDLQLCATPADLAKIANPTRLPGCK
jgi:tetratricopeptide (TPR) repeat protein